ncbi:class I SAM-dependent methyltransferase [Rhodohalobacter sp. 614A]|uniref:class I SAM-dependent methyltransferase n=1 Tax=Rhodohalobacter sp. 614A TaxID=2908649 RepID=UPI001F17D8B5|nr:methyltransferase domain-containing protein [Rhodohalobacter sp. 614A]
MKNNAQQTEHTRKRYNATSVVYDFMEWPIERIWYNRWRKMIWDQVKGQKVLEIGVGTGKNLPYYSEHLQITAIDLSPGMLKRARKKLTKQEGQHVVFKEMDTQNLEFDNDSFDEVMATFAFCSVPDPVLGLKEALRVTKPSGKLHLLEHMRSRNSGLASVMDKLDNLIHWLIGVHIARETVANVENAGWNVVDVKDLEPSGIFRMIEAEKPY